MQRFTTYTILILILGAGLMLMYRGCLGTESLKKIEARVLAKKVELVSEHNQTGRYGLTFFIENYSDKLGVYVGTKDQSENNELLRLIDTIRIYTFFIDPTVTADNGINLGVREIKLNDTSIYKESGNLSFIVGLFFTVLSSAGLIIVHKFRRRK